jgi:LacI family transcriptional regulator
MKDVAEAAGVSVTTVSHVLNRTRFVSVETIRKVEDAIKALNFKVNHVARNLRIGSSFFIGFVISNMENYIYLKIAKSIEKTVKTAGYQLTMIDSAENKATEMKNIESLYMRDMNGIVIAPTTTDCAYLKTMLPADFPLVFVDRQVINYSADCVLLNNEKACFDAVSHLVEAGRRRIAFVSFHFGVDAIDPTIAERVKGYKEALVRGGIEVREELIRVMPGTSAALSELKYAEPYRAMRELLQKDVDAVCCGNSLAAIGVYTCLQDEKIPIPDRVALMTFDDDLWLSMAHPHISAVEQPAELMGRLAAERLLARISGKVKTHEALRADARLILRESC